MELSSFEQGKTYVAKKRDFEPPDGSPTVPGEMIRFTVLEPANADNRQPIGDGIASPMEVQGWAEFLRVFNYDIDRVHLLHPSTIESATEFTPGA